MRTWPARAARTAALAGERVVQPDGHRPASSARSPAAEIARPAPSAPVRLPLDALTLTRVASSPSSAAIAARIASRWPAEPRPGGDDRQVDARDGRSPARATRRDDLARAARRSRCPAGVAGRPGTGARGRPGRRAEQRVGDGVEGDVAVGVAVQPRRARITMPPSASGSPGPNGWLSWPMPDPAASRPAERRRRPGEIRGQGHLEVARVTGDDMDRDGTGLQQGGLVGPGLGPVGRDTVVGRAEEAAPDALRGLRRREAGAIDRRDDAVPVDPLQRLGDGHDRDGRAVPRGRLGDGVDQPGRTSGRAPSWTSTTRRRRARRVRVGRQASEPGGHRFLAPRAARDDRDDACRQPAAPRRSRRRARRRSRPRSARPPARGERLEGPGEERPAADRRSSLSVPPIRVERPAATTMASATRSARIARRRAHPRRRRAQSRRGWAKIIRPATVCSTRVTATSTPGR